VDDLLTHLDGVPLDSDEGARLFAKIEPSQTVTLTVRRGPETLEVVMTAAERSDEN